MFTPDSPGAPHPHLGTFRGSAKSSTRNFMDCLSIATEGFRSVCKYSGWVTVSSESNTTQRHYLRFILENSLNRHIVGHGKGGSRLPAAASRDDLSVAITEQTQFQLRSWNWNAINCKRRFGRNTCRQLAWGSSTLSDTVRQNLSRNALYNHIVICILIL